MEGGRIPEEALAASHGPETVVGTGCDDQWEFEFGVDLLLEGIQRWHQAGWPGR
ncbi:MAG: hypothetical protein IPL37_13190 [Austwickia sp.]|jgi:hypothetical protein|nr:hypothetical protein [Austwickia sp.]